MLRQYKVCVIPDKRIITLDKLPHFSIIEGNIKDTLFKKNEFTKRSKMNYQNINSLNNSSQFYMQLNSEALQHLPPSRFESSPSVNTKKIKNRVTGYGACTRVET